MLSFLGLSLGLTGLACSKPQSEASLPATNANPVKAAAIQDPPPKTPAAPKDRKLEKTVSPPSALKPSTPEPTKTPETGPKDSTPKDPQPATAPTSKGADVKGERLDFLKDDIPGAMAKARKENRPVFIHFTGYQCEPCKFMEDSVFPRPEIHSRLAQMVLVNAYTDCDEKVCEVNRNIEIERFDSAALPLYAAIDPYTDKVIASFVDMTKNPKEYETFLQEALDKYEQVKPKTRSAKRRARARARAQARARKKSTRKAASSGNQ